jgi:glucose/arabinose dehydrogenase
MVFYTGDKFPAWRGSVLVGALAGQLVARLETSGQGVTGEERMLRQIGERIRDIRRTRNLTPRAAPFRCS